jgi:hypothetical protein
MNIAVGDYYATWRRTHKRANGECYSAKYMRDRRARLLAMGLNAAGRPFKSEWRLERARARLEAEGVTMLRPRRMDLGTPSELELAWRALRAEMKIEVPDIMDRVAIGGNATNYPGGDNE